MNQIAAQDWSSPESVFLPDLLPTCNDALSAAESLRDQARSAVANLVIGPNGKPDPALLEQEQFAVHGFAWLCTYTAALREMLHWAERLESEGAFRDLEKLMLQAAFGEYLSQIRGGIALSQVEILRLADMGLPPQAETSLETASVRRP